MVARPRVVVTGNARRWSPSWWCTQLTLRLLGARAIRVSTRHRVSRNAEVDALIIGGGDDISPNHYGQPAKPDGDYDPARDALEIEWIQWALKTNTPMLGICRGAQLINVVLGGELNQNIRSLRKRTYNRPGLLPTKQVWLDTRSTVRAATRKGKLRVNSLHYQVVTRPGEGMRAAGWDLDEFIQATEHSTRAIMGVQWHPEYLFYLSSERRIFAWLLDCVSARKERP